MSFLNIAKSHRKLLHGVGINDADYPLHEVMDLQPENGKRKQKLIWRCPYWFVWSKMIERCYSKGYQKRQPTYMGCWVCDEWLRFSNFKRWMEQQEWQGKVLDKDILKPENKLYSPETCIFISQDLNNFLTDSGKSRGKYKIGVSLKKATSKFASYCSNPFTKKLDHLGYYETEEEAHQKWLEKKLDFANEWGIRLGNPEISKLLKENIMIRYVKQDDLKAKAEEFSKLQEIQDLYSK